MHDVTGASERHWGTRSIGNLRPVSGSGWLGPAPPSTEYTCRQVIDELTVAAENEPPVRTSPAPIADGGAAGPSSTGRRDSLGRRIDAGDTAESAKPRGF